LIECIHRLKAGYNAYIMFRRTASKEDRNARFVRIGHSTRIIHPEYAAAVWNRFAVVIFDTPADAALRQAGRR
jgi:hypothetical protein